MTVVPETHDQLQNNVQLLPEVGLWHFREKTFATPDQLWSHLQHILYYSLYFNVDDSKEIYSFQNI